MKLFIQALIVMTLMVGCGGYNTGTIQKSEKGFLKFSGDTFRIMISIDDGTPFSKDPQVELYELNPGKHIVKVLRDSEIIVNRQIIIDNQTIFEIEVK